MMMGEMFEVHSVVNAASIINGMRHGRMNEEILREDECKGRKSMVRSLMR